MSEIPFYISRPELGVEIGTKILEFGVFMYYLATTKRFFRMLNFRKRNMNMEESLGDSDLIPATMERDSLIIAMILMILLSLFTRILIELPFDIAKVMLGNETETARFTLEVLMQYLFHIPQRAAVLINVARWFLLYFNLTM